MLRNKLIESKVDFLAILPIYRTAKFSDVTSFTHDGIWIVVELKVKFSQVTLQSQNNFLLVASQNIYALFGWWPSVLKFLLRK